MISGISEDNQHVNANMIVPSLNKCVIVLTKSDAFILCSLSLNSLFDDSFSGSMETTLPTFDPIHQLNLFKFRIKPVEVPAQAKHVLLHMKQTNCTLINKQL